MSETIPEELRKAAINLSDTITLEREVSEQSQSLQNWQTNMILRALLAERISATERAAKIAEGWLESAWTDEVFAARSIADAIRRP